MYCVYITEYSGKNLPRFYIGSTSVDKINAGYRGSVSSIKYRDIWESEPSQLFNTKIIKTFEDRAAALSYELELHKELNVVDSPDYINMSYAQPDGFFGRDVSGSSNPMYGKSRKGEIHKGGDNISKSLKEMYASTQHGKSMKEESRRRLTENNPSKDPNIIESNKKKWKDTDRNIGEKNGMHGKKSPMNGKRLYNNGVITMAYIVGDQPEGWNLGRHIT